jgi:sucrose-6-phosphate hydrolase SacC (GH32 family)
MLCCFDASISTDVSKNPNTFTFMGRSSRKQEAPLTNRALPVLTQHSDVIIHTICWTYSLRTAQSFLRRSLQLVKNSPAFYGTRRFFTVLTSARHLSLSWADSIQSPQPTPTSWRSILTLSSHLRLGLTNGLFPSGFPTNTLCTPPIPRTIKHERRTNKSILWYSKQLYTGRYRSASHESICLLCNKNFSYPHPVY